jgi:hypothetical protein
MARGGRCQLQVDLQIFRLTAKLSSWQPSATCAYVLNAPDQSCHIQLRPRNVVRFIHLTDPAVHFICQLSVH